MKKLLQLGAYVIAGTFLFNSCEAWEDESYHPGGNNNDGGGMLLKEVKTTSNGLEGKATYTYDDQNRTKEVYAYANILDMQTYSHVLVSYSGANNAEMVTENHIMGQLFSTITASYQLTGNIINLILETEAAGQTISINNSMTFSAPCGVSQNNMTTTLPGFPPMESVVTYEYTDANCSFKEYTDGVLSSTVTNDNKFSPYTTPENHSMGISSHNPTRIENADGSVETIAYTYNENNYPTKAVHTFSGTSTEQNFTEEFTYY